MKRIAFVAVWMATAAAWVGVLYLVSLLDGYVMVLAALPGVLAAYLIGDIAAEVVLKIERWEP